MSQPTAATNPLFYGKPELLMADRHEKMGLSPDNSFTFAAKAISIPLNAVEIPVAHAYPIVFANVAPYIPLAITGLRQDENLFVRHPALGAPIHTFPPMCAGIPSLWRATPKATSSRCASMAIARAW